MHIHLELDTWTNQISNEIKHEEKKFETQKFTKCERKLVNIMIKCMSS